FFSSSRRRHTRFSRDWSSDVCSSDLSDPALVAPDRYAAEIAFHWHGAGRTEALAATLEAARVAERLSAPAEQAQLLARALDLWEDRKSVVEGTGGDSGGGRDDGHYVG